MYEQLFYEHAYDVLEHGYAVLTHGYAVLAHFYAVKYWARGCY